MSESLYRAWIECVFFAGRFAWSVASFALFPLMAWKRLKISKLSFFSKEGLSRVGQYAGWTRLAPAAKATAFSPGAERFWIHAASVGETLTALRFCESLKILRPDSRFLITCMNTAAWRLIEKHHGFLDEKAPWIYRSVLPVDSGFAIWPFFKRFKPKAAFFFESETWPNLIQAASKLSGGVSIIQGRVSFRTHRFWMKRPNLGKCFFKRYRYIITQSPLMRRLMSEASGRSTHYFGNMKRNVEVRPLDENQIARLKARFNGRFVWTAASVHVEETEDVLETLTLLEKAGMNALCFLAPRHPDRLAVFVKAAQKAGIRYCLFSEDENREDFSDVNLCIVDAFGILDKFYAISPMSFIGGSFAPKGGHNVAEAVLRGCVPVTGPSIHNFMDMFEDLFEKDVAEMVETPAELADILIKLFQTPALLETRRAKSVAWSKKGGEIPDIVASFVDDRLSQGNHADRP